MATIQLPTEFREFLRLMNSRGVDYLVVGGYAVAHYGHPRTTGDLDVWVAVSPENADRVRLVLLDFGFTEAIAKSAPLGIPGRIVRMGTPPLRIEILTGVTGVAFEPCHSRRELDTVEGVSVSFISREDLLANKRAAGRPQDLADVEELS